MIYNLRGFCPFKACKRFNGRYLSQDGAWRPSGVFYLRNRDNSFSWGGAQETLRVDNHTITGTIYNVQQSQRILFRSQSSTWDPTQYDPPWIANSRSENTGVPATDLFQTDTGLARFYNITPIRVGSTGGNNIDDLTATVDIFIGENMTTRASVISRDVYYYTSNYYKWFYVFTCFEIDKQSLGRLFVTPVINLTCSLRSGGWSDENGVVWNYGDSGFTTWIDDVDGNRTAWGFDVFSTKEYVPPRGWTKWQ